MGEWKSKHQLVGFSVHWIMSARSLTFQRTEIILYNLSIFLLGCKKMNFLGANSNIAFLLEVSLKFSNNDVCHFVYFTDQKHIFKGIQILKLEHSSCLVEKLH